MFLEEELFLATQGYLLVECRRPITNSVKIRLKFSLLPIPSKFGEQEVDRISQCLFIFLLVSYVWLEIKSAFA